MRRIPNEITMMELRGQPGEVQRAVDINPVEEDAA